MKISLFTAGALFAVLPLVLEAATYHVSPSGVDTNPGTLAQPFRTVQKGAAVAVAGDTVLVRAGTYRETVTPAASGTSSAPITFQNYPGEIATISGSDVLTGWTSLGGGVYRAPMAWNYSYELVTNSTFPSNQVFLDGQMLNLLRWPKETNHDLVANPREGVVDSATASGSNVILNDAEFTENPARWLNAKVWVNLSRNGHDGQGQTGTVTAASTGQLTLLGIDTRMGSQPWGVGTNTRYHLFQPTASALADTGGVASALAPGEWWFDSAAGQTYVRTWDGQPPAATAGEPRTVEARRRSWAFSLAGRSWITVRGLHLFAASIRTDNSSATRTNTTAPANNILLDGLNGQYLTHFTDCSGNYQMQWVSKSGIILSGSNITLQNSILRYSAGSGVSVLGQGNKVLNNVIADMNYSVSEAGALNLGNSYGVPQNSFDHEIANNTIYRTPQQGINFRGLKNSSNSPTNIPARIHHNTIHDVMMRSYDSAAIDSFGTNHQFIRIDHNLVFNVFEPTNFGIYFDFASGGVIDHNLVFDVARPININWTDTAKNQNMRVFNNTAIADPPGIAGLSTLGNTSLGSEIRNNLLSGPIPTIPDAVSSNNLVSSNALYTSIPNSDYTLAATATAAIDKGVATPFDDPISGAAPDIGSFERGLPRWSAGSSLLALQPAPGGLRLTQVNSSTVQLDWTDRSADETHFIVMRSNDGGVYWDEIGRVPADAQTFTDTRIPGGRYLYAVRGDRSPFSVRAAGRGNSAQQFFYPGHFDAQSGGISVFGTGNRQIGGTDPGEWIRFDNLDFGAAGSVTTFTANYSSGNVNAEVQVWLDNPSSGTRIATLKAGTSDWVYRDVSGTVSATASGVHNVFLKFTHSGTANMGSFRFLGNAPTVPPAEPSALTATWNGTAVQLAWTDASSDENEFRVERSVSGGPFTFFARPGANVTSATDTTVLAGIRYRYRICAANMAAPSAFSSPAVLTIPASTYTMLAGTSSWGNAASWSPAGPPGATDSIQHTAASAAIYDLDASRTVKDFTVNSSATATIHGKPAGSALTVAGALSKSGSGALVIGGWNAVANFNGAFTLNDGSVGLEPSSNGGMNFANGTAIALNGGTLKLVGDATNRVTNFGTGSITLAGTTSLNVWSFSNDLTRTLTGAGGFTKTGNGRLLLKGAGASYAGATAITAGTLQVGADNVIGDGSAVALAGGTLAPAGFSETVGTLAVTAPSRLDFTGSGALTFAQSQGQTWSATLAVTNFDPATCRLRFGSSNTALTAAQLGAITINGGPAAITADGHVTTPNAAWLWAHFQTFSPTGNAAASADPDADGLRNLLERGLGLNPKLASTAGLPALGTSADRLTITFTRAAATTDLTFRVEAASDLTLLPNPWTEIYAHPGVTAADQVTVSDTQTGTGNGNRFLRLRITQP